MRRWFSAVPMLSASLVLLAAACGPQGHGSPAPDAAGARSDASDASSASPDGPNVDSSDGSVATSSQALLRIAQLSPDLPPIDVCVAPHGTASFQGPLLAQLAGEAGDDGGASALLYAQVSAYLPLGAGAYDVRLVAAGAGDCSLSLPFPSGLDGSNQSAASLSEAEASAFDAPARDVDVDEESSDADMADGAAFGGSAFDATTEGGTDAADAASPLVDVAAPSSSRVPDTMNLPPLGPNTAATLIIAGDLARVAQDKGLAVTLVPDDASLSGGAAALRAVNAVPSVSSLDFGLGSFATSWLPLLTNVSFGSASAQAGSDDGVVDSNGYLPIGPLSAQLMSARATSGATTDTAVATHVTIEQGSVATIMAIGGKTGDPSHPPAFLLCVDNQPSGGLLSDCSIAQ